MNYLVSISHEAEEDLRGIYAQLAFNLLSLENAKRQVNRIEKAIKRLDQFPMRYPIIDFEPWKSRGLHVMPCDHFIIFYFVEEENHKVLISRILYGRRNIENALGEND